MFGLSISQKIKASEVLQPYTPVQKKCMIVWSSHQTYEIKQIEVYSIPNMFSEYLVNTSKVKKKLFVWMMWCVLIEMNVIWFQSQAECTEHQIKQQFEKLHQFLRDEEEATITALREEDEQKKQMMVEKLDDMNRDISALSHTIKDMEEIMKANDVWFHIMDWLIGDWLSCCW